MTSCRWLLHLVNIAFLPCGSFAIPPICKAPGLLEQHDALVANGFNIRHDKIGLHIGLANLSQPELTPTLASKSLVIAAPNGTIAALKCVLECLVPGVFGSLTIENFGAEALMCAVCRIMKLDDGTCENALDDALYLPILLMAPTAYFVFKECTPHCPWGYDMNETSSANIASRAKEVMV